MAIRLPNKACQCVSDKLQQSGIVEYDGQVYCKMCRGYVDEQLVVDLDLTPVHVDAGATGLRPQFGFSRGGSAEFPYPQEVVFRAVQQAIEFVKGASIDRIDAAQALIEVKVGTSAWSWGENVSLSVVSAGPRSAKVQILSSAKAAFNVSAIGKNEKNFQAIVRATAEVLERNGEAWTKRDEVSTGDSDLNRGTSSPLLVADEIQKLADLRAAGILTDEEFVQQKARLLGS